MAIHTAKQRYQKAILLLSITYAATLIGAIWLFEQHLVAGPLAYAAALAPALTIIGMFAAIGRYLAEERDEFIRMMMVRQALIASGFALTIATAWGFLESFGLVDHIDSYYIAVLWFGGLGVGSCVNKLKSDRWA